MRTMREMVDAIENPKIRALAFELMEKLDGVRTAIQEKRQRGEKVSAKESAELQSSLANYVKKGLTVALVTTMLATSLAGCEMGKTPEKQPENNGKDSVAEEVETGENARLVIVPQGNQTISPEACGIGILSAFDLTTILTDDSAYQDLNRIYQAFLNDQEYYDPENDMAMMATGIMYMTGGAKRATGVMFEQIDEQSGWEQRLISSNTGLVLVSTDKNDKSYLTGFVEGKLRNDIGLIPKQDVEIIEDMAQDMTYLEILDFTRKNFFGEMYRLSQTGELDAEYLVENPGIEGHEVKYSKLRVQMKKMTLSNERGAYEMFGKYTGIDDKTYERFYTEESQAE